MAKYSFAKQANDISDKVYLEAGWVQFMIAKEPAPDGEDNAAMKAMKNGSPLDAEGKVMMNGVPKLPGKNIVLRMRAQTEDPETHGRSFTVWLPLPMPGDDKRINSNTGRTAEDEKLERIYQHAAAFNGIPFEDLDAEDINFEQGQEAFFPVSKVDDGEGGFRNEISFNAVPRPLSDAEILFAEE